MSYTHVWSVLAFSYIILTISTIQEAYASNCRLPNGTIVFENYSHTCAARGGTWLNGGSGNNPNINAVSAVANAALATAQSNTQHITQNKAKLQSYLGVLTGHDARISALEALPVPTNGIDGRDGVDGTNGINGTNGVDGTNGIDGIDGTNGADGTNGTNGRDGIDGVDGKDGKDGANGRDGRDGRDAVAIIPDMTQVYRLQAQSNAAASLAFSDSGLSVAVGLTALPDADINPEIVMGIQSVKGRTRTRATFGDGFANMSVGFQF